MYMCSAITFSREQTLNGIENDNLCVGSEANNLTQHHHTPRAASIRPSGRPPPAAIFLYTPKKVCYKGCVLGFDPDLQLSQ